MAAKLLLTGRPGVGKTTLVRKVIAAGIPLAGGFLTEEVRQQGRRVGFRVRDIHSGQEGTLARTGHHSGPKVGKYTVDVASFDRIGVKAVREAMHRDGCVVIDEVGRMELCSKAFREMVPTVIDSGKPILATLSSHSDPLLDDLRRRKDVTLVEVTRSNRDTLPMEIARLLGDSA